MKSYTENEHSVEATTDNEVEEVIDKVEKLPEDKRQIVYQKLEIYQGDLPHPDILKGYNELYPEAAQKIIDNGIAETEHRRSMERRYLQGQINDKKLGQTLGFIIAVLIISGGVYLIMNDHQITGTIMTGISAIGVIGLFTGNSNQNNKETKDD